MFIGDGVDDVCAIIVPRLQNGLSVVPHYKALRESEQEVFVYCNEAVLEPGRVAVVHLPEKI